MSSDRKLLRDLFLTLFRSNDDLYETIDSLDYSQMHMLLASLPGTNQSRISFTLVMVEQLEANALIGPALFDLLAARFPARAESIRSVKAAWAGESDESEVDAGSLSDRGEVTPANVEAQEKLMGNRATFLDVSYLAKGAKAAQAVVKLRMKLGARWYFGTAFLISPTRLLTAFHNVENDGVRATEIQAIFDYEAAVSGAEAEGTRVACLMDTAQGEAEDDWAVIDIATRRKGVTPLTLAKMPAQAQNRVAIIQHPGGMAKQVALHNNLVTYADDTRLQYLTDTLKGSSGAPVFNADWEVVAVHHAGGDLVLPGTKDIVFRNQGTPSERVVARMKARGIE